jgi:hypothetical protein
MWVTEGGRTEMLSDRVGPGAQVTGARLQASPAWIWILARMTSRIPADRVCRGPRLA